MPTYNYKSRELIAKIVYYGPGRCGKTTNLQQIHAKMRPETRSDLLSVATETDRTIYFDLLPLNLGTISGMKFMVRLFTVPGQVYYSETRKLVLKGADGVVFVADSQDHMIDENRQSLRDLKENLIANGIDYNSIPLVLQWNKRDLPHLIPEAELNATLNDRNNKTLSAVASQGTGVLETLRFITLGVFNNIKAGGKAGPNPPGQQPRGASMVGSSGTGELPAPTIPGAPGAMGNVKPGSWSAAIPRTSFSGAANGPGLPNVAGLAPPGTSAAAAAAAASRPPPPAAPPAYSPPAPAPSQRPLREDGPQPVKITPDLFIDEFKNLAMMASQLAERMSAVEAEMIRLGRENQEIREIITRQSRQ